MNTMKICSGCQKPLEANAPDGLCPECLLKAGLGTGVDLGPDSQAESGQTAFVAPSVEEVARLFPQLEILGFIGQGGMGAVYKARQKALDRVVALKILPPGIGKDAAFAERFTREAKALARLNHTGIVTLYEFGQADGLFFFLMEFVDGMSLRHLMEVERISAREALAIVPQICDALQYAHDQGIVHRDIKPENILLDRQGRVKVADFGLAKLVGTDAGGSPLTPALSPSGGERGPNLTDAGKVMGTPQYMAPEQREHPTEVDHRADIYSLGVVFYQMLTGELPGKPIEAPSHKVQIDVRLDEVVLRALEKEPARRYQQVSQVKTAVETIDQSRSPAAASPQPADWRTWSPFQSPQVREICAHMTEAERREGALRGTLFGIWNAATFILPCGIAFLAPKPLNWIIAPAVLLLGLAFYPLWQRIMREFLVSTVWARQQGIAPGSLRMSPRIILVGRRSGQAAIHWPGVLLAFLLVLVLAEAGAIFASAVLTGAIQSWAVAIALFPAVVFMGMLVRRGQMTPVEKLTSLDGPSGTALKPAGRKWPLPLVGLRNGERIIHWPGLLVFAGLIVAVAAAVPLMFYVLTPVKSSLGLVVGLVVGIILLTIKLQQAWTTPIERLPRLDKPERSHAVGAWVLAAVGLVLLILAAVIVVTRLARESREAESVRRELRTAEQARLAIAQGPSGVWEVRSDCKKAITPLTASGFGPVIERVIATPDADDQGLVFFDMETGKSFKPPFPLTFQPNQGPAFVELTPQLKEWNKASRVDFLVHLGEKTWDMMTLEMQEEFAGQLNEWKTIPPEKVIGVFAKKDAAHLVRDEVPAASFGHSYREEYGAVTAFRTRSNTMGVYQLQGMGNSNRRGVGIRYKVVLEAVELPAARLRELQLKANEGSLPTTEAETKLKLTQAKMEYLKYLALGAVMFAEKNNGSLPKDLRESFSYPGTDAPPGFLPDLFELVCQGRMSEIKDAAQTIIIREKDPVKTWDGQWMKCYAFADRHVEVHVELAGQFEAWEKARLKSVSRTFSLRHMLASEMGNDLGKILLGRVGMEARPAPDNMQLTVTAPPDVLNRVSTFVFVADWPKRIAPGPDYYYPRGDVEQAGRSFFYACSIEDIEGVTRMLAPGVLAELKGTKLTARGGLGEEQDAELVRQLRGKWDGKEAAVRKVVLAWNRFPLRRLEVGRITLSRRFGPRYFTSAAFEGAPVESAELSFIPERRLTNTRNDSGPEGPLLMDTLPPWYGKKEAGVKGAQPVPDKAPSTNSEASKSVGRMIER